jgi:hypothetical protein
MTGKDVWGKVRNGVQLIYGGENAMSESSMQNIFYALVFIGSVYASYIFWQRSKFASWLHGKSFLLHIIAIGMVAVLIDLGGQRIINTLFVLKYQSLAYFLTYLIVVGASFFLAYRVLGHVDVQPLLEGNDTLIRNLILLALAGISFIAIRDIADGLFAFQGSYGSATSGFVELVNGIVSASAIGYFGWQLAQKSQHK